jgi:hypothetical protein
MVFGAPVSPDHGPKVWWSTVDQPWKWVVKLSYDLRPVR